ncbi:MAG: DNA mismatch repair endonuclease MutL [Gemmatimonadota bacterium]
MARRIQILPDHLANQIAAGEVVERPASVVKELVENALDAAATRIEISIQNGGKTEIRVADDGTGMSREDALLALDRHATSKISSEADLLSVQTLGFRGEALPSIASVSHLVLETAEPGGVGTRVRVSGGRILGAEDCARQGGTTVIARNLFFNVPARAKFLKSAAAETRAVVDVVITLALAHLSTSFRLESNGRTLLELPATTDLASRIADIWDESAAARLIPIARAGQGVRIAGLVERPDAASIGPRRVYLFVGGRPIRDREVVQAAERAYRTTVPLGVRPSLFLYLDVEPGGVDVNVHPAKAEVRFRDRQGVHDAVEAAVREALGSLESAATLDRRPLLPQLRRPPRPPESEDKPATPEQLAFFVAAKPEEPAEGTDTPPDGAGRDGGVSVAAEEAARGTAGREAVNTSGHRPALWQVHETYILAETRSGLLIIDQHSAHERILFEAMMRGFSNGGQPSQRLLFPLTLRLSPAEYAVVEDMASLFRAVGFEIEPFGGRTIIVHAAPTPHPYFDAERCLREMITELAEGSELTRAAKNQYERIAMTFACKGAIKAGQRLSQAEMAELFDQLFATELPSHDVHGRPTIIRLSLEELERRFGRHG